MTIAIIGTGGIGSAIARLLATGGESLQLSSTNQESAHALASRSATPRSSPSTTDTRCTTPMPSSSALRFSVLKDVIDEVSDVLGDKLVIVPSNPVSADAEGNIVRLLSEGDSSGEVVAGWLPEGARLVMTFGTMSADLLESSSDRSPEAAVLFYVTNEPRASEEVEPLIRLAGFEPIQVGGLNSSSRLEVGGDLHDLVVTPSQARSVISGD